MKRTAWVVAFVLCYPLAAVGQDHDLAHSVRVLRLRGDLAQARGRAEEGLAASPLPPAVEIALRLELARIADRVGLHHNTRPVAEAFAQVEAAAVVLPEGAPELAAAIELARAELQYRLEMSGREFAEAMSHARSAEEAFTRLGDARGRAEAVHRLGLIHMQRGELAQARALFHLSLEYDQAGGERPFFRGEYERHIAFVELFEGRPEIAIPHLERSLALRRQVGAVDASLFAAITLAATLLETGQPHAAWPHLLYAMTIAARIDSPSGRARLGIVLGKYYVSEGANDAARAAFETALEAAESVGANTIAQQARDHLLPLEG